MQQDPLFSSLVAFTACSFWLWFLQPVAHHIGLLDHPRNDRKFHAQPVPLIGGIAVFLAFSFAVLVSGFPLTEYRLLFAGALLIVTIGVLDDFHELSAHARFGVQIAASLLMTLGGQVVLRDLGPLLVPGPALNLGLLAVPVTVFATVGVMNAVNLIDGLDGLAASLMLVALGGLAVAEWQATGAAPRFTAILAPLGGALLAFLPFNLRPGAPALAFLGDAGSLFLGFVLAWLLICCTQGPHRLLPPVVALWLVAVPLFDTVATLARRLWLGRSPFLADREHAHHLLLAAGLSPPQALAVLVGTAVLLAGLGLGGHILGVPEAWLFYAFLALFFGYFFGIMRAWRRLTG